MKKFPSLYDSCTFESAMSNLSVLLEKCILALLWDYNALQCVDGKKNIWSFLYESEFWPDKNVSVLLKVLCSIRAWLSLAADSWKSCLEEGKDVRKVNCRIDCFHRSELWTWLISRIFLGTYYMCLIPSVPSCRCFIIRLLLVLRLPSTSFISLYNSIWYRSYFWFFIDMKGM